LHPLDDEAGELVRLAMPEGFTFGCMSMWLYQLNQQAWSPEIFRREIWEQQRWHWTYGRKRGEALPEAGDTLVFFYSPNGRSDPGFYGWAVIERCDHEESTVYFLPAAPTDHLKMDPWWDKEAKKLADDIRGTMKRATLFKVPQERISAIRRGITKWLRPVA
jgi:hypothetical protein